MSKSLYTTIKETTAPTTATVGVVGQLYLDTSTKTLYQCVSVTTDEIAGTTTYEWKTVGDETLAKQIQNNDVQIASTSPTRGLRIGNASNTSTNGISIGAMSSSFEYSIAIGPVAQAQGSKRIQLGNGMNIKDNTLQVFNDNIYNHSTHTLTVQNIELNGVDLGTLLGDINTALETILGV